MIKTEHTIHPNEATTFQTRPESHWKYIAFDEAGSKKVDGVDYWFTSFVNSGQYIIHDVTTIVKLHEYGTRNYYYVWYEKKP